MGGAFEGVGGEGSACVGRGGLSGCVGLASLREAAGRSGSGLSGAILAGGASFSPSPRAPLARRSTTAGPLTRRLGLKSTAKFARRKEKKGKPASAGGPGMPRHEPSLSCIFGKDVEPIDYHIRSP